MKSKAQPWSLPVDDNQRLLNVCGPLDQNLRWLENTLGVQIKRRGSQFEVIGPLPQQQQAFAVINTLFKQTTGPIEPIQFEQALQEHGNPNNNPAPENGLPPVTLHTRKGNLQARGVRQAEYIQSIQNHDIAFGIGPAGTGKTYLAVACAVDALERDSVERLVLTRPAVEAGERQAFCLAI
jgi:phosphate starvation-inducible PhoH-like protein